MTLEELYNNIKGDYQDILARFQSEFLIDKFVRKFETDTSFQTLCDALDKEAWEEAFLAVHTLKGLCLNLSFSDLGSSVSKLTEELRSCDKAPNPESVNIVKKKYYSVISCITEYLNSL